MRMGCLVEELAERGHSVLWWGSAFDHFKKEWLYKADTLVALRERVEFFALRGMGYKKNISLSRFLDHRLLSWKFRRLAPSFPAPDVLVASIPPYDLAYEAAVFSSNRSIPYLVDIRDPWPELFVDHCPSFWRGVARFLLGREFRMARKAIFSASMVLSVTEEMLAWGIRCAGREKTGRDRVLGLGFSPLKKGAGGEISSPLKEMAVSWKGKFVVLFLGAISKSHHNPNLLLDAARKTASKNIHFVIAGDGEGFEDIRRQAIGMSNVSLTGWLNRNEIQFVLDLSNVGVCPSSVLLDIPSNKFYCYLFAGLPVVSSFGGEIRELIEKKGVGMTYPPGDVEALVECLNRLWADPVFCRESSQRAMTLFRERFDSRIIYKAFADHIESVAEVGQSHRGEVLPSSQNLNQGKPSGELHLPS